MTIAAMKIRSFWSHASLLSYPHVLGIVGCFYLALVLFELVPKTMFIRSMPQDLFFQLDVIYRILSGDKIYVDFSTPLGIALYAIPLQFVHYTGNLALSISYASGFLLLVFFPMVAYLAWTRLPPLLGLALGIWIGLALAARMNFGDDPTAVTFAMNYNRQGAAALALAVLMYRAPLTNGPMIALTDGLLYAILTSFLIYTKITFGLVALAFAPVVIWPHRNRLVMFAAFAVAFGLLVAAVEFGYGARLQWVQAIETAIASSRLSSGAVAHRFINLLMENLPELLVCTLIPAWFLWKDGRLTSSAIIFFVMIAGASVALIVENGQRYYLFLPAILFFVAAPAQPGGLSVPPEAPPRHRPAGGFAAITIAVLALGSGPLLVNILYAAYQPLVLRSAMAQQGVLGRIVIRPEAYEHELDLSAILDGRASALDAFAAGRYFRPVHPFDTLTMSEFGDYLRDGMRAVREGCSPNSRILTLDVGNPFPMLLSWPAGGPMIIIHPDRTLSKDVRPTDEEMFRNVTCVLVPKMPVKLEARDFMIEVYNNYLADKFITSYDTPLWKVLALKPVLPRSAPPTTAGRQ